MHRDPLNHAPFPILLCINDIGTHDDLNINYLTVVGSGIDIATTTSSSVYRNMVNSVESHLRCGILWRTGRCCYSTSLLLESITCVHTNRPLSLGTI